MFLFSAIRFEETDRKFNRQRLYGARSRKHEPVSLRRLALQTVIDDLYAVWPVKRQTMQVNSTDGAVLIVDIWLTPSSSTCTCTVMTCAVGSHITSAQISAAHHQWCPSLFFTSKSLGLNWFAMFCLLMGRVELFALTATAQHWRLENPWYFPVHDFYVVYASGDRILLTFTVFVSLVLCLKKEAKNTLLPRLPRTYHVGSGLS